MSVQTRRDPSSSAQPSAVLSPGRRLFVLRRLFGWNAQQLAEISRVHRTTIDNIERIDPVFTKPTVRNKLAAGFEVEPEAIWPHHQTMTPWWTVRRGQHRIYNARSRMLAEQPTAVDYLAFCQERGIDVETLRPMIQMTANEAAGYAADCLERYAGIADGEQLLASFGLEAPPDDSGPG